MKSFERKLINTVKIDSVGDFMYYVTEREIEPYIFMFHFINEYIESKICHCDANGFINDSITIFSVQSRE